MRVFWCARASILLVMSLAVVMFGCQPRAPKFVSGSPDVPEVSAASLVKVVRALGMDEGQRAAAAELHGEYARAHDAAARKYRDFMAQAERLIESTGGDKRLIVRREEGTLTFARHAQTLAERFLDDLRLTLTAEQARRWEEGERALRRSRSIGAAHAERTADLGEAVEGVLGDVDAAVRAEVEKAMRGWEEAIDPVIVRKEAFIRTVPSRELEAARKGVDDPPSKAFREWRVIVREERLATQRGAREVAALLPEGARESLERAVQERLYPWLFETSEAAGVLRRAGALEGLSARAKEEVAALRRELGVEERALAGEAARALDAWERTATEEEIGAGPPPELNPDLVRRYHAAEARVGARLREVLTMEQFDDVKAGSITRDLPALRFDDDR